MLVGLQHIEDAVFRILELVTCLDADLEVGLNHIKDILAHLI